MGELNFDKLLNAFSDNAKKLSKKVSAKASETVESAKLKFAITETEDKISDCKKKIGDVIYKEYLKTGDFGGELGELCKRIDNLNDDMEVMKDKLAEVKNSRRCSKCGKMNYDKNTFCAECGTRLYDEGEESNEQ